ncbi:hypothetical protein CYMTET_41916 [Cymbomonas tetramitiformis]|uniref:Exostosin GT47 domain-containing protein n=1 Tax=Cymbomonas tetramitiformis TaxID=36881 RepID=A0AAE0C730_9CHLO|nr:hypothetical protein CYMTET_41916 [Cymbomonas tetramitiformis]
MQSYLGATFCLQPPGDTATRKGIFDSLMVGCIPVIFDEQQLEFQYELHIPSPEAISVLISKEHQDNIFEYLESIPTERVRALRDAISKMGHSLQYAKEQPLNADPDALDVAISHLLDLEESGSYMNCVRSM